MRVEVVVCDVCAELHRYHEHDEVTLAALMVSADIATSTADDLGLLEQGWRVERNRHYCPEHYPTGRIDRPVWPDEDTTAEYSDSTRRKLLGGR